MKRRKIVGLFTAVPESVHVQRVFEGIFTQCQKYGYDVAVFSPMAHLSGSYTVYTVGEVNIWELANFDLLDGVIVDTISLVENNDETIKNAFCKKLERECKKPIVSLNLPLGNYPVEKSSDEPVFRNIMEHVLDVHKVKKVCFLTGPQGYEISEERLNICLSVMKERGLEVPEEWKVYGDFWYSSGTSLAQQIVSGQIERPEAVVCASDHMAIGLVNYLVENGVRVPEDIIVTGFEAFQEAALNTTSVTSFESNETKTAADGMDLLYTMMEPGKEVQPMDMSTKKYIHPGMSCGCAPDFLHSTRVFKESFYFLNRDFTQKGDFDIGQLMEGYVAEVFAESETSQECLQHIYLNTYFLQPYTRFFLCLKEDWLAPEKVITKGYPKRMKIVVHNTPEPNTGFYEEEKAVSFETKLMLPQMLENEDEPSVYYFSPVHFRDKLLGYCVLQRPLTEPKMSNLVHRNWLRNVNIALEMIQTKSKLTQLSISDEMTGAYNRRGMDIHLKRMLSEAQEGDSILVGVIDMDGLKYVNDTFGHGEGDFGIKQVHKALLMSAQADEICVRAGGDEFYLFGVGKYTEEDIYKHMADFQAYLDRVNATVNKPYLIGASIGMEIAPIDEKLKVDSVINAADVKMYTSKVLRKKQRV